MPEVCPTMNTSTNNTDPEYEYARYLGPLTQDVLTEIARRQAWGCLEGREAEIQRMWRRGETRELRALAGHAYRALKGCQKRRMLAELEAAAAAAHSADDRAVELSRRRDFLGGRADVDSMSADARRAMVAAAIETLRRQLGACRIVRGRVVPDHDARLAAARELLILLGVRPVSHTAAPKRTQRVEVRVARFARGKTDAITGTSD